MWGDKDEGMYFAAESIFFWMDNPVRSQVLAVRGFWDDFGTLTDHAPGTFIGSKLTALSAGDIGEGNYLKPGYRVSLGYRLRNDIAFEFSYWNLAEIRHQAGAGIVPPGSVGFANRTVNPSLADSFISAPFYNFTPTFAGPANDVISRNPNFAGLPLSAYGIWNAAEDMSIELVQKVWNMEMNCRMPINQTECDRTYAIAGARYINVFERFRFRTVDIDLAGNADPINVAVYNNLWENRLYGAQVGMGYERYLGQGFSWSLEGRVGLFLDQRLTGVNITRGDDDPSRKREDMSISPMLQGGAYLWWYPIEGVQLRAGYELLTLWNVRRSEQPVSFDVQTPDPAYEDMLLWLQGFTGGIAFIF
jgi:hypothetical protein